MSDVHDAATLEQLTPGAIVAGIVPDGPVTVVAAEWHGTTAITLTFRDAGGRTDARLLYRSDEGTFSIVDAGCPWAFDGDGALFRLVAEARRIQLAHLFDPMLAVSLSTIEPLPHQIQAVYGHMLRRQPLRFLLADDPGAGKTIMAGLYIKELMLRGDLERCLIVAPGSLVTQWHEELREKFDLDFEIVTRDLLEAAYTGAEVLADKPRLIARIDQLARRPDVIGRLKQLDWDLVVVDEAHRMAAHFYGNEVKRTKRYELGEVLSATTRHLLLMTATPHAGKEEDFQLFLALLDSDCFEGRPRDGIHRTDTSGFMRRMVKEKLLRFDGTPLFPERRASTVVYPLSSQELHLYEEVTEYVREGMNRADRLSVEGDKRRGNTVGFALTVLQRRLASSPEAIYQSLRRRRERLQQRLADEHKAARDRELGESPPETRFAELLLDDASSDGVDVDALDELDAAEYEEAEQAVADSATAARTVAELEVEIATLKRLEALAADVRRSGVDRKWSELSGLLSDQPEMRDANGHRRKLIIFTEHRDTLNYLVERLRTFLGERDAVVAIHGGTNRVERRRIQSIFTSDPTCTVLVATDAAGEGINLQRAHLVINYDLPWNPNRIEQRFGRVHRIGQTEVCHMWNLVAQETREAQVYLRLLDKIEEQRHAYRGQVFDVLGQALPARELRQLLLDAIRYGERPDVRARINQVIDDRVGEGLGRLIAEQALSTEVMAKADVDHIRLQMEEAQARRLQPHYIRSFFVDAFQHLGGQLTEREPGRYEVSFVPAAIRNRESGRRVGPPVARRYERVVFEKDLLVVDGAPPAQLLAPGHPLLDAVIELLLERSGRVLTQGTVLVDPAAEAGPPRVLVLLEHAIADARPSRAEPHTVVSRRFEFVELPQDGEPYRAGDAPYLDYRPATVDERARLDELLRSDWLATDLERVGTDYAIEVAVPDHLATVRAHTEHRVERTRQLVWERLTREISFWDARAVRLRELADAGRTPRMNPDRAAARVDELVHRREVRIRQLDQERSLKALPPRVVGGALVVPVSMVAGSSRPEQQVAADASALARAEVERRAVEAVLESEAQLGRRAVDLNTFQRNHPGYDVRSIDADGQVWFLEVKGRIKGADTVTVTRNEILTCKNQPDRWVLALVEVDPQGVDTVRYLLAPFATGSDDLHFAETGRILNWRSLWELAKEPV